MFATNLYILFNGPISHFLSVVILGVQEQFFQGGGGGCAFYGILVSIYFPASPSKACPVGGCRFPFLIPPPPHLVHPSVRSIITGIIMTGISKIVGSSY